MIPQPGPTIQWADPELGGLGGSSSVVASKSGGGATIDLRLDPAGFRTLLVTFAESPDVGTPVELILDPGVIEDYYNNATTEPTTFSFTWPATDTILNDTRAPRLDRASVIEGCVELVFDEEIDPATWSAATIDQGAVDWASCEDGFGLCQQTCLATGAAHTLELGATLADLAGNALDGGAVGHGFDLSTTDTLHIWRRPDPRLLTSATGSVVDKSVSSAVRQALGFHGLPIDPETGLVYVRHRYYDPEMGRFLSQDPLGYVDGGNLYQYGLNNPGDLSDPLGLDTCPDCRVYPRIQARKEAEAAERRRHRHETFAGAFQIVRDVGRDVSVEDLEMAISHHTLSRGYTPGEAAALVALVTGGAGQGLNSVAGHVGGMEAWLEFFGDYWQGLGLVATGAELGAIGSQAVFRLGLALRGMDDLFESSVSQAFREASQEAAGAAWMPASGGLRGSPGTFYSYTDLRALIRELGMSGRGTGLEAHHLLEKRFAGSLGLDRDQIISVALTPRWHRNVGSWGQAISPRITRELQLLGTTPANATAGEIWVAHRNVYHRLGQPEWAQAVYDSYFKSRGLSYW